MNQTIELIKVNKPETKAVVKISRIVTTTFNFYLDSEGVESYKKINTNDSIDMKEAVKEIEEIKEGGW